MAENLMKKPSKGILKNSKSFDKPDERRKSKAKFDEMNIIATLHPADKDYGHMKIDEPKTPFNYTVDDASSDVPDHIDAQLLAEKLQVNDQPRVFKDRRDSMTSFSDYSNEDEDDDLTPEEMARRKEFEMKRKKHYNEYQAIKLAKKLMEEDEDEDDDQRQGAGSSNSNDTSAARCSSNVSPP